MSKKELSQSDKEISRDWKILILFVLGSISILVIAITYNELKQNEKSNLINTESSSKEANNDHEISKSEKTNEDKKYDIEEFTFCGDNICNNDENCNTCSKDCGVCETNKLENMKETIVWVKYNVLAKNQDGSYFEFGGTGSGVIVGNQDNELIIYTNRHVVDCEFTNDCFQRISEEIQVRTQDGKMYNVDEVSFSESDIDLAILSIKTEASENYNFAYYSDELDIGNNVVAIGYPSYAKNVVEFSVSKGKITNIRDVLSQSTGDSFRVIESDAYTYFGSSGGGLFDTQGNLIGINTWIDGTQTSIAIDFSSIEEDNFVYCEGSESYFAQGSCWEYCERDEVMTEDRNCVEVCDSFYCNSKIPNADDDRCRDEGHILGDDGYCHLPCSNSNSYCETGSICFNNECHSQCIEGYLFEDGTCRYYE